MTASDDGAIPVDSVERLVASWRAIRPDLDVSALAVVNRLARVRGHLDVELATLFARHGLTPPGFEVLVTLARLQEPSGVSQRRLSEELGLTSGTISVRIDRLVEQGLVEQRPDPDDRRNSRITLTERGRELFERAAPAHLANLRRLVSALEPEEQEALSTLLSTLLVEFEGSRPSGGAGARLGLVVAPSRVAIQSRAAVGLPERPGLLVTAVDPAGPAAAAGLLPGDLLVGIRSITALRRAIANAPSGRLTFSILRGADERRVGLLIPSDPGPHAPAATVARTGHDEHHV